MPSSKKTSPTYASSGVNIDKANEFVNSVKKIAAATPRTGVMGEIGGFGGLYSLKTSDYENPVLVSSTDGVGTKLKIAFMTNKHDTVGIDLVAMCVNDVVVQGAKPLFFLDYLAMGTLDVKVAEQIISGIAEGCRQAQCALIAGETAELPGFYKENEYDLAGFAVGAVDNDKLIDGSFIRGGHKLIGLASSGLHSNGYSLARKVFFDILKLGVDDYVPELEKSLGEELLIPTKIYSEAILRLVRDLPVHGLAHITGGGIAENLLRVIPSACNLVLYEDSWDVPPVFKLLEEAGKIERSEMLRTFNNGLGMIAVVPDNITQEVLDRLAGMNEKAWVVGEVVQRKDKDTQRFKWGSA